LTAAPTGFRPRSLFLLLALLALAAYFKIDYHLSFAAEEPLARAPYGDSVIYLEEAAARFGPEAPESSAFYKPPLYTFLLHLLAAHTEPGAARVRLLQGGLGGLVLVLVFLMARSRGGDLAGAIAFACTLAYAPLTFHETKLLDTIPSLFLTVLACWLLDRMLRKGGGSQAALITGIAFGLAALARSANLLLAVGGALLLLGPAGPRRALLLLLGAVLPVLPVSVWNTVASGDLIPINYSEGHTFLVGNNPNAEGIYNLPAGYPDGVANERRVEFELARRALGRDPTPGEQRNHSYASGWRYLREHPSAAAALYLKKLRFLTSSYPVHDNYSLERERRRFGWLGWAQLPFTLLLLAGVASLLLRPLRGEAVLVLPLVVTGLLLLIFYVTERYRLPMVPFLAIAAGAGVSALLREPLHERAFRLRLLRSGVVLALLGAFVLSVPLPASRHALAQSERTFDVILDLHAANNLREAGKYEAAASILARVVAAHPGDPSLEQHLLSLLHGRTPEELTAIARAAREAAPLSPRVEALLALAGARR